MPAERRLLGERYEVGDVIGHGGMADVHRGRDIRLGRDVAIKLLRSDLSRDPAFEGRFRREAQSAALLNSPSIVAVYDTGEDIIDGTPTPYIVMEYVDGQTLRDILATEGRLLPTRALEITAAVCSALELAHAAGIVHRDIKPGNVMVTAAGEVKVMDFGIARALTGSAATMTQTATVVGTAHYLSPEQARGEHVDARSDVYSTGCLLYELLTGAPPFTGETAVAVAYQHVREDPAPPSSVEPDVSDSVDAIVLVAMAKNPVNRYASAADMRADIERALSGQPVQATPVQRVEDSIIPTVPATTVLVREPPHRRRGLAYVLLAVATLGVFVAALVGARGLLGSTATDLNAPDVLHQSLAAAKSTLIGQGLVVGAVTYRYTDKGNQGQVIDQSPPPGSLVRHGEPVGLTVSNGIKIVTMPQGMVGQSLAGAEAALTAAGFTSKPTIVPRNSSAPPNQVLASHPAAGASVASGSPVTLIISNSHVKVPDVTQKDPATASAILLQDGFNPQIKRSAVYSKDSVGLIVSQTPSPGTFAKSGSIVTIYLDKKPPPKTSPPPTTSPTPTKSPTIIPTDSITPSP